MPSDKKNPPIISIVGPSRVGKTTLMGKLIPEFHRRGLRIGTIKHTRGNFEMDRPGKDSYMHKQAGAEVTIISSPHGIGIAMDVDHDHRPEELRPFFRNMDIILAEGYKGENLPKLEVFRPEICRDRLCRGDENLLAVISDTPVDSAVPRFSTDNIVELSDFLLQKIVGSSDTGLSCNQKNNTQ